MTDGPYRPIDGIDCRILNALLEDGRASFRTVADRVDVSPTTVSKRVRALEDRRIVDGFVPRLNYGRLGYDSLATFRLRTADRGTPRVVDAVSSFPTTTSVFELSSRYDLLVVGRFADPDAVRHCGRELAGIDDVAELETTIVLQAPVPYSQFPVPTDGTARSGASRSLDSTATDEE